MRKEVYSGPGGLPTFKRSLDTEMRLKGGLNSVVSWTVSQIIGIWREMNEASQIINRTSYGRLANIERSSAVECPLVSCESR